MIEMSIKLEFCNVIVPVPLLHKRLGKEASAPYYAHISDTCWHDEHLFREGCMDDYVLKEMLDDWEEKGFNLITYIDGVKHWNEVCVVNSGFGPSIPCRWISFDKEHNVVWDNRHPKRDAIGPAGRETTWESNRPT